MPRPCAVKCRLYNYFDHRPGIVRSSGFHFIKIWGVLFSVQCIPGANFPPKSFSDKAKQIATNHVRICIVLSFVSEKMQYPSADIRALLSSLLGEITVCYLTFQRPGVGIKIIQIHLFSVCKCMIHVYKENIIGLAF